MFNFLFLRGLILSLLNVDPLFLIVFLIALMALIVFYFIRKRPSNHYDDRVVADVYSNVDSDSDEVEKLIGASYAKQYTQNYKEAIDYLTRAIDIDHDSERTYLMRGKLYIEVKEYLKAIIDLNKVLEMNPQNETAYYYRGKAEYDSGKVYEASQDFEKAESLGFTLKDK